MMKRIIAFLMAALTVGMMMVSCTTETTTDDGEAESSPEASVSEKEESASKEEEIVLDPEKQTCDLKAGLYTIETVDGVKLNWDYHSVSTEDREAWEETVWGIHSYVRAEGREKVAYLYAGDGMESGLEIVNIKPGGTMKVDTIEACVPTVKQSWYIRDNGDGTYKMVCGSSSKLALGYNGKEFVLMDATDAKTNLKITPTENKSTRYAQWVSKEGNITVRLPIDVVDQVYSRVKSKSSIKDETELKKAIAETMQRFADNSQCTYNSLIELTGFTPYPHIIIYAFEHQDVMAGVVGGNCNIFVNVDWYVDDMEKMYLRWEKDQRNDFNFCTLHEMGHMFDWDRGWTFESEMQTDMKASYVLWDNQGMKNGAWGAPAEYPWNECFNIDNIDVGKGKLKGGYQGLSANMKYVEKDGEVVSYTYSIYRSAQMYVSYIKYCEATEGLSGFEGLKKAFHWYQDNGKNSASYGHDGAKKFHEFNAKLEEFMGLNVEKYMLENARETLGSKATWIEADWYATKANQEHRDKIDK